MVKIYVMNLKKLLFFTEQTFFWNKLFKKRSFFLQNLRFYWINDVTAQFRSLKKRGKYRENDLNERYFKERTNQFSFNNWKKTQTKCAVQKRNEKADSTHLYFCLYLKEINYVTLVPCLLSHKSANCLYIYI